MRTCTSCGARFDDMVSFCPHDATALAPAPAASPPPGLVGGVLGGRYRVTRKLGDGGMGTVYEALHERLGRRFAVKVLNAEYSRDPEAVERFQREARAAASVGNEHIIDVTDFDVAPDGAFFIVMEFLDGEELRARMVREGRLPLDVVVEYASQIADALESAHRQGIVHRDLKPENVYVVRRPDGRETLKVLDFGISKVRSAQTRLTRTGTIMGTVHYMSPEQARGEADIDARTDVWALGAMIYEMLTGRTPFESLQPTGILTKILLEEPPPLDGLPPEIERVVLRALAKDRNRRFPGCRDLVAALGVAAGTLAAPAARMPTRVGAPAEDATLPPDEASMEAVQRGLTQARSGAKAPGAATALAWERPPTQVSSRRRAVLAVAGVAVGLAAVGLFVASRGRGAAAPVAPAAATSAPASHPAAAAEVEIRFSSTPPGARVVGPEYDICTTPCKWRVRRSDREVAIRFRLDGHAEIPRSVAPDRDRAIDVVLQPAGVPSGEARPGSTRKKVRRGREAAPNPFDD